MVCKIPAHTPVLPTRVACDCVMLETEAQGQRDERSAGYKGRLHERAAECGVPRIALPHENAGNVSGAENTGKNWRETRTLASASA